MKNIALPLIAALALGACSEQPAAEPAPVETAAPAPEATLPAPDQALFSLIHEANCPEAKQVNTAVCKRAGITSEDVICEYGLGDDEYLRNKAVLTPGEGEWVLADSEAVCAAGA